MHGTCVRVRVHVTDRLLLHHVGERGVPHYGELLLGGPARALQGAAGRATVLAILGILELALHIFRCARQVIREGRRPTLERAGLDAGKGGKRERASKVRERDQAK